MQALPNVTIVAVWTEAPVLMRLHCNGQLHRTMSFHTQDLQISVSTLLLCWGYHFSSVFWVAALCASSRMFMYPYPHAILVLWRASFHSSLSTLLCLLWSPPSFVTVDLSVVCLLCECWGVATIISASRYFMFPGSFLGCCAEYALQESPCA